MLPQDKTPFAVRTTAPHSLNTEAHLSAALWHYVSGLQFLLDFRQRSEDF